LPKEYPPWQKIMSGYLNLIKHSLNWRWLDFCSVG
jgi:hypothetical protein